MRYIKNQLDEILYCIRSDDIVTDKYDCDIVGYLRKDKIVDSVNGDTLFMVRTNGEVAKKDGSDIIGRIYRENEDEPPSSPISAPTVNFSLNSVGRVILWGVFFYFTAPLSVSLIGMILLSFLLGNLDMPSVLAVIFFIVMFISYIRYCVQLYGVSRRLRLKKGVLFKYYLKWVLKGPFAYKNLNVLKRL